MMLARLTIKTKLLLLSSILIAVLVGTTFYLTNKLIANTRAVARTAELAQLINVANDVRSTFGEHRYWVTDLAVSLLRQSELNADDTRRRLSQRLDELARWRPELVALLRPEVDRFDATAMQAVKQYTDDQRVLGNVSLAEARQHSVTIDHRLAELVADVGREASQARERVVADASRSAEIAAAAVAIATVLGIVFTLVVLRSILVPLRGVVSAIDGITVGNLEVPIPPAGRDEIGAMAKTLGLFRESIVERGRLAGEADRQRRLIETALETISDGFVLFGPDDRLVLCNRKFRELYPRLADLIVPGTAFETILQASVERHLIDLDDQAPDAWMATRKRQHVEAAGFAEYCYDETWVRISERRTRDGSTVAVYADITELKHRERALEVAMAEAEAANDAKSAFLANMSHELRTPLNAIIGYSEMLHEIAQDDGLAEYTQDLAKIQAAGRHLLNLISDVLDLSKVEAGKMDVYLEDIDLPALVQEIRSIVTPLVEKNHNRLSIDCSFGGFIHSDRTKLKQGLLNLLSNATKFTSNGEVTLSIHRDELGASIVFQVRDTGIGMTPDQMSRLFTAFAQADASTTKRYGGTGLGLAITKHFVEILGGLVTVASEPGLGSTFTIKLPDRRPTPAEETPPIAPPAPDPGDAPLVMVVDDDSTARELLAANLRKQGWRVAEAEDGEGAINLARKLRPKAITLDIMMPRMDGWSVLQALKSAPDLADIPVIVVTTSADRGMAFSLGASDFMTKPIERTKLASILSNLMQDNVTVLLVDDEPHSRELARRQLDQLNIEVFEARDGREAIAWLSANPSPGMILLDLMMPGMDGFAVLDAISQNPSWTRIPVVILTAMELSKAERDCIDGRARHVIAKGTMAASDLAGVVRQTLSQRARAAGGPAAG
jgi:signal transduction histidine kinase/DNA-binding response OmpR family regulator/HAMP domain-containing protein